MIRRTSLALPGLLFLLVAGCPEPQLQRVVGEVAVEPTSIAFPRAFVGYPIAETVTLTNRSRASRTVELQVEAPFELEDGTTRKLQGGESLTVRLFFRPETAQSFAQTLRVTVESQQLEVPLTAVAEDAPDCSPSSPCVHAEFDPESGGCVETALPEDSECTSPSACVIDAHCIHQQCVGKQLSCDDENPCTTDACDPATGCIHQESEDACAPPADPCKVAFCDPLVGCGIADAVDGTSCGERSCELADVCIAGVCKTVPVPEGATCGAVSPCQAAGSCHDKVCVQPPGGGMTPVWTYTPPPEQNIVHLGFTGATDAAENLYWFECRSTTCKGPGCLSFCDLVSGTRDGAIRWRVPALSGSDLGTGVPTHQLVAGSLLITLIGDSVLEARRLSDGAVMWSHDFPSEYWHPVLESVDGKPIAKTRFAEPSADATQLIVPFAGFVSGSKGPELADSFLSAFDLQTGNLLWQAPVTGYSVSSAIDEQGNVYSSSVQLDENGAVTAYKLQSWTSSGSPRWLQNTGRLRNLAVAGGRVLVDGLAGYDSTTGASRWDSTDYSTTGLISDGFSWVLARGGYGSSTPLVLSKREVVSGTPVWEYVDEQASNVGFDLVLTSDSSALFVVNKWAPQAVASEWHLDQVTPDGGEGFSCAFPAMTTPISGGVLLDQRWVTALFVGGARALMAFDVPGQKLATQGWIAPRADKRQSGAAR